MTTYFAWVESSETTFESGHVRNDELVVSFRLDHNEGDFAKLTINVENPRIGPLALGRPVWAWLSWRDTPEDDVVPLGFFRLIGIPSNIVGNVITYELIARPNGYQETKAALADSMRVLPFYDEIFIDQAKRSDPDSALEGYSEVWHIDRITHEVTTSDVLVGEDGVEEFSDGEIIYDSVNITMDRAPLSKCIVNGEIPWTQTLAFSSGTIDLGTKFLNNTAIADAWPQPGTTLGGGYVVVSSFAEQSNPNPGTKTINYSWTNRQKKHKDGDLMSQVESLTSVNGRLGPLQGIVVSRNSYSVVGDPSTGTPAEAGVEEHRLEVVGGMLTCGMSIAIDASGDRREAVTLTVVSDLQPVLKDPDDDSDSVTIDLNTADVADCSEPVGTDDPTGGTPTIGDAGRGEYITTDRGLLSVQYMIAVARARLCVGARCVGVTWEGPFKSFVNLSCRKNARIFDPRIPGGEAIGKIISYSLRGDGISGEFRGSATIACAVGLGNAITTADGTADYVDETYVDDYQTFTGQVIALPSGDIGYGPPVLTSGGAGMAFPNRNDLVIRDEIVTQEVDEADLFELITPLPSNILASRTNAGIIADRMEMNAKIITKALADAQVWREIELLDVTNQTSESAFSVPTTPLVIPRQIDLMFEPTA